MRYRRMAAGVGLAMASALALAGCAAGSGSAPAASATTSSPATSAADASACVPNPKAVVARKPAKASMGQLPANLAAPLNTAAAAAFATTDAPGAVVAVRSPKGTWIHAYGVANLATKAPMTTDVYHRIGSVTKTFTATLVMQLVAEHKLSLSDPISKYVSGVPDGKDITVRDLITMRSGLGDYLDPAFLAKFLSDPTQPFTLDQTLAVGLAMPREFAPGAEFSYSNTNYALLDKVVQEVTKQSFAHELASRIFTPLHLTATSWPGESNAIPSPHAQSYTTAGVVDGAFTAHGAPLTNATSWNPSIAGAAGEIISTANNLLTWGRDVATGQGVLPASVQIQRLSSFKPAFTPRAQYGIGLMCRGGWVGHGGDLLEFHTDMYYDTRSDTTVVVEINQNPVKGQQNILTAVAAALGDPIAPLAEAPAATPTATPAP